MDALFADWFGPGGLVSNGITTAGQIYSAIPNAQAQVAIAAQRQAAANQTFLQGQQVQALTAGTSPFSGNLLVFVMIGVIALFVINQANK